jgi:hypothetical protein
VRFSKGGSKKPFAETPTQQCRSNTRRDIHGRGQMGFSRKLAPITILISRLVSAENAVPDAAATLARILEQKGTISPQELSRVEAAASQERVSLLATILRDKGVLSPADVARLSVSLNANTEAAGALRGPSSASPATAAPTSVANVIDSVTKNVQWSLEYRRLLTYFRQQALPTGRADQFTLSGAYNF